MVPKVPKVLSPESLMVVVVMVVVTLAANRITQSHSKAAA